MSEVVEQPREADELVAVVKESKPPLGLPEGSIRAIIALILLFTTIADYGLANFNLPEEFHALTIAAVSYYIGARSEAFLKGKISI